MLEERAVNKHYKLGKQVPSIDPRTLKLSKYASLLPPPPPNAGYIEKAGLWGMMENDVIGDCTCAAAGHMIQQWTAYAKATASVPSDAQILSAYQAVSGYNPNNPGSDRGAVMLDVLKYWRKHGIAGHKIYAFVAVNPRNHTEMKQAIELFGNVYIGLALPNSAQDPKIGVNGFPVWSRPDHGPTGDGTPWSWGGHCVPLMGYGADSQGNHGVELITWGQVYDATWGFLDLYCDEAYAVLTPDWINAQGESPSGFDLPQLTADLAQL